MFSSTSIFYSVGVKVLIQIAEDTIVLLRKRAEKEENPLFSSLATSLEQKLNELKQYPDPDDCRTGYWSVISMLEKLWPESSISFSGNPFGAKPEKLTVNLSENIFQTAEKT